MKHVPLTVFSPGSLLHAKCPTDEGSVGTHLLKYNNLFSMYALQPYQPKCIDHLSLHTSNTQNVYTSCIMFFRSLDECVGLKMHIQFLFSFIHIIMLCTLVMSMLINYKVEYLVK